MVARKPLPENAAVGPSDTPQLRVQDMRQDLWSPRDSDGSADHIWGGEPGSNQRPENKEKVAPDDVPDALRPGLLASYPDFEGDRNVWDEPAMSAGNSRAGADVSRVPTVLRPGGRAMPLETNPFKRRAVGGGTSQEALNIPSMPADTPPVPPTASFSQLSTNEPNRNPWQPAWRTEQAPPTGSNVPDADLAKDIWDSAKPSRQPTPGAASNSPALLSLPSEGESPGWDEEVPKKAFSPAPRLPPPAVNEDLLGDSHAWDDLGGLDKGKGTTIPPSIPTSGGSAGPIDEWNLIDPPDGPPPQPPSRQSTWENFEDTPEKQEHAPSLPLRPAQDEPPNLPPRSSSEQPPTQPPRPVASDKSETYQIKNINWYDVNGSESPRQSPILVQNANGPCPLVALVNALTLTTPAEMNTVLVETLRLREQISLGFLLDAVFDELMSSRRHNPDEDLPDVTELYAFLKGLHTGMNVNPRFIPTPDIVRAFKRTSLTHLHPTERGDMIPGTFEDTKEMQLYATFSIPLIHGWLPPMHDPVYEAFERRAASYEDVQNLLFMEEELEDRLSNNFHQGLTEQEQEIYQDILAIKSFLSISATQLTPWGLEVISKAMRPGSVAILFRNDHFSTLYRHPQSLQLLTLVTDAGYATHDEVVWESLVDVNGEHAEFFSGDFRPVGGASPDQNDSQRTPGSFPDSSSADDGAGLWHTVQGRRRNDRLSVADSNEPPLSPKHEQEDRDLALALQLQEEEDERHRAEQARRRRESMLSEQFIEQQGRQPANNMRGGGRRAGNNNHSNNRSRGGVGGQSDGRSAPMSGAIVPNRRSSSAANILVSGPIAATNISNNNNNVRGGRAGRGSVPVQQVRSLIPPRNQAVSRPADEGLDDAPPSYEQAAKQTPYVPPAGHPSHPSSAPDGRDSTPASASTSTSALTTSTSTPVGGPRNSQLHIQQPQPLINRVPGRPPRQQGIPPSPGQVNAVGGGGGGGGGGGSSGKERDCVVM